MQSGDIQYGSLPVDNGIILDEIRFSLAGYPEAARYNIEVRLEGTEFVNDWDFWVFPAGSSLEKEDGIIITGDAGETLLELSRGKTVLFLPDSSMIRGDLPGCFTSIYWNCHWTDVGESSTMGILTDPSHPLFNSFPTEFHSNWQWWELLTGARPMIMDDMPAGLFPLVQPIDDYHRNRKLGLLFEGKSGKGKLLVCCMDIQSALGERPAARQFRNSLIRYMKSGEFDPETRITRDDLYSLLK
jgi:hypothetical protein